MVEQETETHPDGSAKKPHQEQQSSQEIHPIYPAAPTRAQQQRHRRNLRLNGQVDIEEGSKPRYLSKNERRDSWIDRINSSTKDALRRTSTMAAIDEKKLIDTVADSINQYGEEHEHDSWADKIMGFLFPSIMSNSDHKEEQTAKEMTHFNYSPFNGKRTPIMSPSDKSYDKTQMTENQADLESWAIETTDRMDEIDQRALNPHPHLDMTPQTSDQACDDVPSTCPDFGHYYVNDGEEQAQITTPQTNEDHIWPPLQAVDQSPDIDPVSIEEAKKERRRQRQQQRKQSLGEFAA
ncbi:hypothetical protein BC941DRAFT_467215 [Chlamydoabsidia padenii]|nr:hypothetical protein BC941DRAFT_467215 [Chlamydoabsidia padenii]